MWNCFFLFVRHFVLVPFSSANNATVYYVQKLIIIGSACSRIHYIALVTCVYDVILWVEPILWESRAYMYLCQHHLHLHQIMKDYICCHCIDISNFFASVAYFCNSKRFVWLIMVRHLADMQNKQFITTFLQELVKVADKIYGVTHKHRVSCVKKIFAGRSIILHWAHSVSQSWLSLGSSKFSSFYQPGLIVLTSYLLVTPSKRSCHNPDGGNGVAII